MQGGNSRGCGVWFNLAALHAWLRRIYNVCQPLLGTIRGNEQCQGQVQCWQHLSKRDLCDKSGYLRGSYVGYTQFGGESQAAGMAGKGSSRLPLWPELRLPPDIPYALFGSDACKECTNVPGNPGAPLGEPYV